MTDKFGREMEIGNVCFRVKGSNSRFGKPTLEVVIIKDFTNAKVKIGERSFVNPENLTLASDKDLSRFLKGVLT